MPKEMVRCLSQRLKEFSHLKYYMFQASCNKQNRNWFKMDKTRATDMQLPRPQSLNTASVGGYSSHTIVSTLIRENFKQLLN